MPATRQQPAGIVLPNTPVVVLLGGPAGAHRACRVEAPARLLRLWFVPNAADHELHQVKLPPQTDRPVERQPGPSRRVCALIGRSKALAGPLGCGSDRTQNI
jgi:hypothetical protein